MSFDVNACNGSHYGNDNPPSMRRADVSRAFIAVVTLADKVDSLNLFANCMRLRCDRDYRRVGTRVSDRLLTISHTFTFRYDVKVSINVDCVSRIDAYRVAILGF